MKKRFTFLVTAAVLLLTMMAPTTMWGQTRENVVAYTFATTQSSTNNAYANNYNITVNGVSWSCPGNQNFNGYVRIGGKSLNNTERNIFSKAPIDNADPYTVSKVVINHSGISNVNLTVNSVKVTVASDASFTNVIETITLTPSFSVGTVGTITFNPAETWSSSNYFKFTFSFTNNSNTSNYGLDVKDITFYKDVTSSIATPIFSPSEGNYYTTQNVTISCSTPSSTIYYTTDGSTPDNTSTPYTTAIPVSATTTIKAVAYVGLNSSIVASATYNIFTPYTTIPALFAAATNADNTVAVTFNNWVVSGVSSNGKSIFVTDGTNGLVLYYNSNMSSTFAEGKVLAGTAFCSLKLYNGYIQLSNVDVADLTITTGGVLSPVNIPLADLSGVNTGAIIHYDNLSCLHQGSDFILSDGETQLYAYTTIYNFNTNSEIQGNKTYNITGVFQQYSSKKGVLPRSSADIELVVPTEPYIEADDIVLEPNDTSGNIVYTIQNPVDGGVLTAVNNTGTWFTLGQVGPTSIPFTCPVNTGDGKSNTVTLTYTYNTDQTVTKNVVLTQKACDYFSISLSQSFYFDGGRESIEAKAGLSQEGLGTNYSSSPLLKFDHTGDWLMLRLNTAPTALSYTIQGKSFSGGTFKVQTSADGNAWDDLATYTTLSRTAQKITHVDLPGTVRYFRWVYTNKASGNVALGTIEAGLICKITGDVTVENFTVSPTKPCALFGKLTVTGTLTNEGTADDFIIYTHTNGELIHNTTGVQAKLFKPISAYSGDNDHYALISAPFAELDPATVTGMTTGNYDLYEFHFMEAGAEWQNYKVTPFNMWGTSGYLYAYNPAANLFLPGTLTPSNEDIEYFMGFENNPALPLDGWEIVGNPFACNAYIKDASSGMAFLRMNEAGNGLVAATGAIKPSEGIFVQATAAGQSFKFTRTAPAQSGNNGNLNVSVAQVIDSRDLPSVIDNVLIRIGEGNTIEKFQLNSGNTKVYIPEGNKEYAVINAQAQGEMPVNFKAAENGSFTISVAMDNLEARYLHLIDNLTGADVDLLATPSYTFEAKTTDYANRFRIVFNANDVNEDILSDTFAFISNGEIILNGVNGNATVQVFDVTGRMIGSTNGANRIATDNMAAGVYMIRLINGDNVKTQKIIVK